MALAARSVPVVIRGEGADAPTLARLARTAALALPAIEVEAGFPLPSAYPQVEIRVYPGRVAETANEVGYFEVRDGTLRVERAIPDWLMVHELAHYWYQDRFAARFHAEDRWLIEGLAHWTARRVCGRLPALADPAWVHRVLIDHTWKRAPAGFDPPLAHWVPPLPVPVPLPPELEARMQGWYGKAYALFCRIAAQAGEDFAPRLHARLAREGLPVDTARYLAALAAAWPATREAVSGWVLPGTRASAPAPPPPVLAAPPPIRAAGAAARHGPPGAATPPPACLTGAVGSSPPESDLVRFCAHLEDGSLALEWTTRGGFPPSGGYWNVGLDADHDDTFDAIVGFGKGAPPFAGRVFGDWRRADWHPQLLAPHGITGRRATLHLPRAALDLAGPVRLFAYTTTGPDDRRADGLGWIELTLPPAGP